MAVLPRQSLAMRASQAEAGGTEWGGAVQAPKDAILKTFGAIAAAQLAFSGMRRELSSGLL